MLLHATDGSDLWLAGGQTVQPLFRVAAFAGQAVAVGERVALVPRASPQEPRSTMAFKRMDDLCCWGSPSASKAGSSSDKTHTEQPMVIIVDDDRDILRGLSGLFARRYKLGALRQNGPDALAASPTRPAP